MPPFVHILSLGIEGGSLNPKSETLVVLKCKVRIRFKEIF